MPARPIRWFRTEWPLVLALLLWVPLALEVTPFEVGVSTWFWQTPLLLIAWVAWWRIDPNQPRPRPLTWRIALGRSGWALALLPLATWIHELSGGGAWFVESHRTVGTSAIFALLLGALGVFEHHAAQAPPSWRVDVTAAALTGWAAFLVLLGAWIQVQYLEEVIATADAGRVLERVREALVWLLVEPAWTLSHFGWILAAVSIAVLVRLRGATLAGQITITLGCMGGLYACFASETPVVTFGLSAFAIGVPLVLSLADRVPGRGRETEDDPPPAPQPRRRGAWVAAVAICVLTALGFAGRLVYRSHRVSQLALQAETSLPEWKRQGSQELNVRYFELHSLTLLASAVRVAWQSERPGDEAWQAELQDLNERLLEHRAWAQARLAGASKAEAELTELREDLANNSRASNLRQSLHEAHYALETWLARLRGDIAEVDDRLSEIQALRR